MFQRLNSSTRQIIQHDPEKLKTSTTGPLKNHFLNFFSKVFRHPKLFDLLHRRISCPAPALKYMTNSSRYFSWAHRYSRLKQKFLDDLPKITKNRKKILRNSSEKN